MVTRRRKRRGHTTAAYPLVFLHQTPVWSLAFLVLSFGRSFLSGSLSGSTFCILSSSGSLLSSLSGSFLSGLSGSGSLLGSNYLSLSLVGSNFSLSGSSSNLLGSISQTRLLGVNLSITLSLPGIELSLSLLLSESTLLDTYIEVLHQHNTLMRENAAYGIRRLCANLYPIESTLEVDFDSSRISVWIVSTDFLNIPTITWRSAICRYDCIKSIVLVTMSCKTDLCSHFAN